MEQPEFIPVNAFEEILVRASTDPSARADFYRELLEADIFFLTPEAPQTPGTRTLETSTQVSFVNWQRKEGSYLPCFSSLQRLQEAVNKSGMTYAYIGMKGKDAFNVLAQRPRELFLNPCCSFGKQFVPDEIRQIADGSLYKGNPQVLQKATKVLLGQPAKYPAELVAALKDLFAKRPTVTAAYLAQMHDAASGKPPHILIGLECTDRFREVVADAGMVTKSVTKVGEFVDFIELDGRNASLESYLKTKTQPFYTKSQTEKSRWKFW